MLCYSVCYVIITKVHDPHTCSYNHYNKNSKTYVLYKTFFNPPLTP